MSTANRYGISTKEFRESIAQLSQAGAIIRKGINWTAGSSYDSEIRRHFLLPLVDYLDQTSKTSEGQKDVQSTQISVAEQARQSETATEEPTIRTQSSYSITFPPYENDATFVFGRGILKDKIAIGFEYGKKLAEDSIVGWNIHSVDEPFVCTFQRVGEGKSTLANCIMLQAAFQGIPVVVFDPKPDYISSLIPIENTIEKFKDYEKPVVERFSQLNQDIRGFDLRRPVDFQLEGRKMQLVFQLYSFNPELRRLGARPLKIPLLFLPPSDSTVFNDMCDSTATSVATSIDSQGIKKGYNRVISQIMRRFKEENPDKQFMLPVDLEDELSAELERATKAEKRHLESLLRALRGYVTANAWLLAQNEQEVASQDELVQNPFYPNGDGKTVTITILDLSYLPQTRQNPARMNYASGVCGYLYNLALRRRSSRAAQYLLIMDEAANYLPEPTDQFNQTLVLIRQGRALGIRVWLIAQEPGQIEIQARTQAHLMVLSGIREPGIRPELTRWQPDDSWVENLGRTGKGSALVIDGKNARKGGILCNLFTSPQTVDLLNTEQIMQVMESATQQR